MQVLGPPRGLCQNYSAWSPVLFLIRVRLCGFPAAANTNQRRRQGDRMPGPTTRPQQAPCELQAPMLAGPPAMVHPSPCFSPKLSPSSHPCPLIRFWCLFSSCLSVPKQLFYVLLCDAELRVCRNVFLRNSCQLASY